jgi:hypothetical protein
MSNLRARRKSPVFQTPGGAGWRLLHVVSEITINQVMAGIGRSLFSNTHGGYPADLEK